MLLLFSLLPVLALGAVIPSTDDARTADRWMHPMVETFFNTPVAKTNVFYHAVEWEPSLASPYLEISYWVNSAQDSVKELLHKKKIEKVAKNAILFLGDGMSINTITAGRGYIGGSRHQLAMDRFPYSGLSKTYCVDKQVADSACTATAYLTGVKANFQTVGLSSGVKAKDCQKANDTVYHTHSIARWAQDAGKRTGLVTTARVTHASPSAVYAHAAMRHWECDKDVLQDGGNPEVCPDIAQQLVSTRTGQHLNVIMGGGRAWLRPEGTTDEEGHVGYRVDKRDLIDEWQRQKEGLGERAEYVWNRDQMLNVSDDTDHLLGLFDGDHMPYNLDRDPKNDPSLEEMVEAAIKLLSKGPKGYFLFVEGARIDMAHHETKAHKALDELSEFSKAIEKAVQMTDEQDTLIVVTADHAHAMTYNGYPDSDRDVLGLSGLYDNEKYEYSILSYANGPGHRVVKTDGSRSDLAKLVFNKDFQYPSMIPMEFETHGGDDVGIFAKGPWAHSFAGVMEQNVIPHLMAAVMCVGDGYTVCGMNEKDTTTENPEDVMQNVIRKIPDI